MKDKKLATKKDSQEIEHYPKAEELRSLEAILKEAEPINKKANAMGWELCIKPINKAIDYSQLPDPAIHELIKATNF